MALRIRTGVVWTGLLRKLYEKSEVRVLEYPPIWQGGQVVKAPACKAVYREFDSHPCLQKTAGVMIFYWSITVFNVEKIVG